MNLKHTPLFLQLESDARYNLSEGMNLIEVAALVRSSLENDLSNLNQLDSIAASMEKTPFILKERIIFLIVYALGKRPQTSSFIHNNNMLYEAKQNGKKYLIVSEHLEGNYYTYRAVELNRGILVPNVSIDTTADTALRMIALALQKEEEISITELDNTYSE